MANELKHGSVGSQLSQTEWEGVGTHVFNSQTTGDILYASSSTQLTRLGIGNTGAVLTVTGGEPAWDTTWTPTGHLIPATDDSYDLGSASAAWQDLFLEGDITLTDAGTIATSAGALTITSAAAATWSTGAGALTIDGDDGITLQTTGSGNVTISEILDITDSTDSSDASGDTGALRTEGGASIAKKLYVGTDLDVDGTANLDAVDVDGAVQIDSTITVGADDQGYDIIFYGDTASANLTWDTSEDDLILNGATRIVVPDGQLVLGSTAVSSTAAELNLLDGVSGLVQADLTKLAAIDATSTEINLIDGGTARGTTSVASGDGILINDGGTMRMTNVDTVSTYFAGHSVGGTSIVTVGTITAGTWNGTALVDAYVADALTISGGTVDNSVIGGSTAAAITGTTIDAGTDFTIGDTVITNGVITDSTGLSIAAAVDLGSNTLTTTGSLQVRTIDYSDGDLSATIADGGGITFAQDITMAEDKSLNLPHNASVKFTDAITQDSIDDHDAQGIIMTFQAGSTVTPFSPVYLHTDDEVHECNAGDIATMPCIGVSVNASDVTDGNSVEVMVLGLLRDESFTDFGTNGAPLFCTTTAGVMSNTAPTAEDDVVQIVGHSIGEKLVFVQPSLTYLTHAA